MPRGDKTKYTEKQRRKADHITEGYKERGVPKRKPSVEHGRRSTKMTAEVREPAAPGGANIRVALLPTKAAEKGGSASSSRAGADRLASAKKAVATRKRNAEHSAHH